MKKTEKRKSCSGNLWYFFFFTLVLAIVIYFVTYSRENEQDETDRLYDNSMGDDLRQEQQNELVLEEANEDFLMPEMINYETDQDCGLENYKPQQLIHIPPPSIRERGKLYAINPKLPKICIVVYDFGSINDTLFDKYNALDLEIAFAFRPNLLNSKYHYEKALDKGRNTLIQLPMEGEKNTENIKSLTILSTMNKQDIEQIINRIITDYPEIIAISNYFGDNIYQKEELLSNIFSIIQAHGLFFIDNFEKILRKTREIAKNRRLQYIYQDIIIDYPDTSKRNVNIKVDQLKQMKNKDFLIVITHAHNDVKYRQLVHFIDRIKDEGYQIVPIRYAIEE